jgi:hypothetical protein
MKTLERLQRFKKRVDELRNLRLVQSERHWNTTVSWDAKSGLLRYQIDGPDEEELRSFLLLFRQFLLKREHIYIPRVFNDCLRFLDDGHLKEQVRKAKEAWEQAIHFGAFGVVVQDVNLTPEYVLDLWINGYYFHSCDDKKMAQLEKLLAYKDLPLARMQFLNALPPLTQIVLYLGSAVTHALQEGLFHVPSDENPRLTP